MNRSARSPRERDGVTAQRPALQRGLALGHIARVGEDGVVFITVDGGAARMAELASSVDPAGVERARVAGELAVLALPTDPKRAPMILGLVPPPRAPDQAVAHLAPELILADSDGKRLRIQAADEIVLECGKASITLRRNGKVIIKGTHVETNSEGTNRIKGGQVRIN
jgi:hypothetical protein